MNIFVLDLDPRKAALYHCDKHVVKMILEYAQLLSTAHRFSGNTDEKLFKVTHINHPCNIWARESTANYLWLYELFYYTCEQYELRYGEKHSVFLKLDELLQRVPRLTKHEMTPFALAMFDRFKTSNVVDSYRNYYRGDKRLFARWTSPATVPEWFIEGEVTEIERYHKRTGELKIVQYNL